MSEEKTILVVDDEPRYLRLVEVNLVTDGYAVETAEHGRKALEVIKSQPIDLVLLDVMMPEMNGYEVLEQLKADRNWRDIPVIMISARPLLTMSTTARSSANRKGS